MSIKNILILYTIIQSLTACAILGIFTTKVDPEFTPYVNEYKGLIKEHCANNGYNHAGHFQVIFGKLEGTYVGSCSRRLNGYIITIDPSYWSTYTDQDKRQLIFHELAHCLIYAQHNDDIRHYMYKQMNNVRYQELISQAIKDIKDFCKD